MMWQVFIICATALLVSGGTTPESRLVNIDQGPVRGYKEKGDIYVFYGIPYATGPTGLDKFRAPLPPPTWTEPLEAVRRNIIVCPQNIDGTGINIADQRVIMKEDCLIANVYVPDTVETNLPVVVYVHGGAYQRGHSTRRTPLNMLKSKKIIAVNFNYRLGAHGFLCLGTKGIPGNAGMKDQIALLRWVQNNIAHFGGNRNDVTIDGWSAGASSVDLIMLSKSASGLFHKVIPESGSNIASFSVQIDPLQNAKHVAKELNFNNVNDINALEDFFQNVPISSLWSVDVSRSKNSSVVFSPCIERDLGDEMFLDDHPVNILKSGNYPKVPMLYGICEHEGIYRTGLFSMWKDSMNDRFSDFFPEDLLFPTDNDREEVVRKVKQYYFADEPVSEKSVLAYVDYFTDVIFGYGTAKAVQLQVEAGNDKIYLYIYGFADEREDYIINTNIRGAAHTDQTKAVMDEENESKLSEEHQNMKAIMRQMWLNFITTGKPIPDNSSQPSWPPVGAYRSPYMYLNKIVELRNSFLGDRFSFWDDIYSKFFRMPIQPDTNTETEILQR